uniref:(northern house mosquito) hypothetical protein n=1 Tax=Culex pipiens TaxID=7175 RepID=A0A8D8B1A6_CULPI
MPTTWTLLTERSRWWFQRRLCIALKVLCKAILCRIKSKIDESLRRQRTGFRSDRSCVDHIVTLRELPRISKSFHLVFVDYEKAFDRLNRGNLWNPLGRKGVPEKIIKR